MRALGLLTIFWLIAGTSARAAESYSRLPSGARPGQPGSGGLFDPNNLAMRAKLSKMIENESDPEKKKDLQKLLEQMERGQQMQEIAKQQNAQTQEQAKHSGGSGSGAPAAQAQSSSQKSGDQKKEEGSEAKKDKPAENPLPAAQAAPLPRQESSDENRGPAPDDLSRQFVAFNRAQSKRNEADAAKANPADALVGQMNQVANLRQAAPLLLGKQRVAGTQAELDAQRAPAAVAHAPLGRQVVDFRRARGLKRRTVTRTVAPRAALTQP
jgi:hypothetical protein